MTSYEIITEQIINKMNEGKIPWVKPWNNASASFSGMHKMFPCFSYSTGKRYDLINQMLLDFEAGEYATFAQIKKDGGQVVKGEKSHIVCGWIVEDKKVLDENGKAVLDDDGEEVYKKTFALRYYRVFNILTQVTGLKPKHDWTQPVEVKPEETQNEVELIESAEAIVKRYIESADAPKLEIKPSNEAYYMPARDLVVVPKPEQFIGINEYYGTLFHELTHSTGKETRCNRKSDKKAAFGNEEYSKEELVAEIGSCFLSSTCGLSSETTLRNNVAYLQSWLSVLKDDPKMIVYASIQAEKACEYILNA